MPKMLIPGSLNGMTESGKVERGNTYDAFEHVYIFLVECLMNFNISAPLLLSLTFYYSQSPRRAHKDAKPFTETKHRICKLSASLHFVNFRLIIRLAMLICNQSLNSSNFVSVPPPLLKASGTGLVQQCSFAGLISIYYILNEAY